jgi:integrase/recombinase XerD
MCWTVDNRRTYMRYFVQWAQERGLHHPMEVTKAILERYQRHLFYYRNAMACP